jgi:hypothetical protein
MRTKVLLCAAVMAASLASSVAQSVYSLNVVGYVNVTLPAGKYAVVANPLDATLGGTVANANDSGNLFTNTAGNLNNGSKLQQFNSAITDYGPSINYSTITHKWASTFPMPPGAAALFYNNGAADTVVTFTGQVPQGTYNVASLTAAHYALVGSPVPMSGDLTNSTTFLGLVPSNGDSLATFNSAITDWNVAAKWSTITHKWSATATSAGGIAPGQGFLYYNNGNTVNNWVSNFTVN